MEAIATVRSTHTDQTELVRELMTTLLMGLKQKNIEKIIGVFSDSIHFFCSPYKEHPLIGTAKLVKHFSARMEEYEEFRFSKITTVFRGDNDQYVLIWKSSYLETKKRDLIDIYTTTIVSIEKGRIHYYTDLLCECRVKN